MEGLTRAFDGTVIGCCHCNVHVPQHCVEGALWHLLRGTHGRESVQEPVLWTSTFPDRGHAARCRPWTSKGNPYSQWASDTWRGQSHPLQHKRPEEIRCQFERRSCWSRVTRKKLGQSESASEPGQQGTTEQVTNVSQTWSSEEEDAWYCRPCCHLVRRAQEEE